MLDSEKWVTKACEKCGVDVKDIHDPDFTDQWLCSWCYCEREGIDVKKRLQDLTRLTVVTQLLFRKIQWSGSFNGEPVCPECNNSEKEKHKEDCLIDMWVIKP